MASRREACYMDHDQIWITTILGKLKINAILPKTKYSIRSGDCPYLVCIHQDVENKSRPIKKQKQTETKTALFP